MVKIRNQQNHFVGFIDFAAGTPVAFILKGHE
jgi:hypothetical protein